MDDRCGGRLRIFWTFQNLHSITRHAAGHGNVGEGCCSAHSMFGKWRLEQRGMFEIPVTWHILKHSQITVSPNSQMCERGFRKANFSDWVAKESAANCRSQWLVLWVAYLSRQSNCSANSWIRYVLEYKAPVVPTVKEYCTAWCSGSMLASHARGPGFNSRAE